MPVVPDVGRPAAHRERVVCAYSVGSLDASRDGMVARLAGWDGPLRAARDALMEATKHIMDTTWQENQPGGAESQAGLPV